MTRSSYGPASISVGARLPALLASKASRWKYTLRITSLAVTLLELEQVDVVVPVGRAEVQIADPVTQHQMTAAPHDRLEYETTHRENLRPTAGALRRRRTGSGSPLPIQQPGGKSVHNASDPAGDVSREALA